jgi:SAM-dependent methyltransferase
MTKIERQRAHFDSIAGQYYEARRNANHVLLKSLIWREFFSRWPGPRRGGLDVLEAMCGFAEGKDIIENGLGLPVRYTGFDYSGEVVARLQNARPELAVSCADVTTFTTGKQYDIVMILGGLHHVPDAAGDVVVRLAAALKPGGHFISLEPTHGNGVFRLVREAIYRRNPLFDAATEQAFVTDRLFALFRNAGLALVDTMYPGLLSYVLYYNPDAFPLLNRGGTRAVRAAFAIDRPLMRTVIGKTLSFATLTLWRKSAFEEVSDRGQ